MKKGVAPNEDHAMADHIIGEYDKFQLTIKRIFLTPRLVANGYIRHIST